MRKISKILYLIAAILSICAAVCYLLLGVTFVVLGALPQFGDFLMEQISVGNITSTLPGGPYEQAYAMQITLLVIGIIFLLDIVLLVGNAILSFKGRKIDCKGLAILNIVSGVLTGIEFNLVAGILHLIYLSKNSNK